MVSLVCLLGVEVATGSLLFLFVEVGAARLSGNRFRLAILSIGLLSVLFRTAVVNADTAVNLDGDLYTPGSGSVSLSYQYIEVNKFQNGKTKVDIGKVVWNGCAPSVGAFVK